MAANEEANYFLHAFIAGLIVPAIEVASRIYCQAIVHRTGNDLRAGHSAITGRHETVSDNISAVSGDDHPIHRLRAHV